MERWYVALSQNHVTVMRIVQDRSDAIALACDMLDRRIEVTGAGPMVGWGEREIDAVSMRQIWETRIRERKMAPSAAPKPAQLR